MVKRYKRLTYIFDNVIEVYEYLDGKYGARGTPREKKKKPTKEEIRKRNQWNKERKARHKLHKYFKEKDWFITFTYDKEKRPADMKAAKEHFAKAIREIRKEYRKRGYELQWIRNIEVGTKNAWHIHIIIKNIPDSFQIATDAWEHGTVDGKLLYKKGTFAEIANYITKTPETEPKLKETSYSTSRNMPLPEPETKRIVRWVKEPKPKEGFYIDKETFHEGENSFTGYKYRYYTMIRLNRRI